MPPRPPVTNPNAGKFLVAFCLGLTTIGLGVGAVYLPYFSEDAKARTARVRQAGKGREDPDAEPEETGRPRPPPASGGVAGSMWKNMKDKG